MRLVCEPSQLLRPIAIVGAGGTSLEVIDSLSENSHLIELVVDNDSERFGKIVENLDLEIKPIEALRTFNGEIFIACAGNLHLQNQLSDLGLIEVNYYYNYLANQKMFHSWKSERNSFNGILENLSDKRSFDSLNAILDSVASGDYLAAFDCVVPRPFFGIFGHKIKPGERILDIGSYRGRHFESLTIEELEMIETVTCVEPDQGNNPYLYDLFSNHKEKHLLWVSKLTVINAAVKATNGVGVSSNNGISNTISLIHSKDNCEILNPIVNVVTLNDFMSTVPTLITADVEGDELELLNGGLELISKLRPRVAISTYHKPEHLKEVFNYFEDLSCIKEYKFRLHDFGYMDQVLYVKFS